MMRRLIVMGTLLLALPCHAQETRRDAWLSPFSSASLWNTSLGSGAAFAADDDPRTEDLLAGRTGINAGRWSHPLFLARDNDPFAIVTDNENQRTFRVRIPRHAQPDPMPDGHLYIVAPDKRSVLEMYAAQRAGDGFTAKRAFQIDLHGSGMHLRDGSRFPGVRAMDASGFGGLIRAWELEAGTIRHALTFMLAPANLKSGPVWPSSREDYWGFRDYRGHVPIGTLIGIPPDVDLATLGLTPAGLTLGRALQDYGAYCADQGGAGGIILSAEGVAEGMPQLQDMRRDLQVLRRYLRAVTNNTPTSPGGGGAPRRPPLPALPGSGRTGVVR